MCLIPRLMCLSSALAFAVFAVLYADARPQNHSASDASTHKLIRGNGYTMEEVKNEFSMLENRYPGLALKRHPLMVAKASSCLAEIGKKEEAGEIDLADYEAFKQILEAALPCKALISQEGTRGGRLVYEEAQWFVAASRADAIIQARRDELDCSLRVAYAIASLKDVDGDGSIEAEAQRKRSELEVCKADVNLEGFSISGAVDDAIEAKKQNVLGDWIDQMQEFSNVVNGIRGRLRQYWETFESDEGLRSRDDPSRYWFREL